MRPAETRDRDPEAPETRREGRRGKWQVAQADRGPESEPGVQGVGGTRKQNDKAGLRASGRG